MTPGEWKRVKEVFDAALELPHRQRAEFLSRACGPDAELRQEVQSLLASFDDAEGFIESPVVTATLNATTAPAYVRSSLGPGSGIGPYRVIQVLGEGGMGTVYQAVRDDDLYRKLVAIKVIRAGLNSDYAIRKFETERQILAHLDHPNIARLLDGGTTPDGRPWFVMDFIAGLPLDEYCDKHRLTVRQRLTLFLDVCSAVQYAHQNLVIHRDLKPQNILVTEEGTVRLLDFGIAKLLDPDQEGETRHLSTVLMLTPQYASPEQLAGEKVTTATDIYSLGVLLYRLLTGHAPYLFGSTSAQAIAEKIRNSEPRRPSTVIRSAENGLAPESIAGLRRARPDRLVKQLAGDLDTVLLLALRKEPERRYNSVEQFAADIRRHLNQEPVHARPDTFRYRSAKFVRRHTAAVVGATLFVLALLGGIAATSWEARVAHKERARAEQRFNEVRELANAVLFDLHDAIEPLPGSTAVRELLVKKAQHYLDHLAADTADDEDLNRERAAAYERVGDVLGLPVRANLGNTKGALDSYATALRLERSLIAAHPDDEKLRAALVRTLSRICNVEQSIGRFQDALTHCGETLGIEQQLASAHPQDVSRQAELAGVYQNMAGAWFATGDWAKSERYRAQALKIFEKLHALHPSDEGYQFEVANACLRMANVQEQEHQLQSARAFAERSVAMFSALSERHPSQVRRKLTTTYALQRLGSIMIDLGDFRGARETFLKSVPIREQLLALDPLDASARVNLSNTLAALAYADLQMGRADEALANFERQRDLAQKLVASDPLRIEHQYSLSEAIENIGKVALFHAARAKNHDERTKHLQDAESSLRHALQIYASLQARNAVSAEYSHVPKRIEQELQQCRLQKAK